MACSGSRWVQVRVGREQNGHLAANLSAYRDGFLAAAAVALIAVLVARTVNDTDAAATMVRRSGRPCLRLSSHARHPSAEQTHHLERTVPSASTASIPPTALDVSWANGPSVGRRRSPHDRPAWRGASSIATQRRPCRAAQWWPTRLLRVAAIPDAGAQVTAVLGHTAVILLGDLPGAHPDVLRGQLSEPARARAD